MADLAAQPVDGLPSSALVLPPGAELGWRFDRYTLLTGRRVLLQDGQTVRLGGRAFDLLEVLLRHAGQYLSREVLTAAVWPNSYVEASSLRVHITALRRALGGGQDYIHNQPGLGYAFVAQAEKILHRTDVDGAQALRASPRGQPRVRAAERSPSAQPEFPRVVTLVGREAVLTSLCLRLRTQRLVSVVGPGGIGKTSVALVLAKMLAPVLTHGVHYLDYAPAPSLAPRGLTPLQMLAQHLGLACGGDGVAEAVFAALRTQQLLIVLDHCDSHIDAAADLCERLLQAGPNVTVLALSREPLRIQGEQVLRLPPLDVPPAGVVLTAMEAETYTAVQLFVQRATEGMEPFALTDHNAPTVCDICRRLDGVPLAIEMAAASVSLFGVQGVLEQIQGQFSLRGQARRGGQARQQSLQTALDWSYERLSPVERQVLEGLSVFSRGFSLHAAEIVLTGETLTASQVCDGIAALVAKSLLTAHGDADEPGYRLLDMTRAYVEGKRQGGQAWLPLRRRHAQYFLQRMALAEQAWTDLPLAQWAARYQDDLDDVRAALEWGFSAEGDLAMAVVLTQHAGALWFHLALVDEYHGYLERALAHVAQLPELDPRIEMRLNSALGAALCHLQGSVGEMQAAFERASAIASIWADAPQQQDAVWGRWLAHAIVGNYAAALSVAEQYLDFAAEQNSSEKGAHGALALGHCLMAVAHLHVGALKLARQHAEAGLQIENALDHVVPERPGVVHLNRRVALQTCLAQVLWLQGFPVQAMQAVEAALREAAANTHVLSTCFAFSGACTVAMWSGDWARAQDYVQRFAALAERHQLHYWRRWAECYEMGLLAVENPRFAQTVKVQDTGWDSLRLEKLATFSICWADEALLERIGEGGCATTASEVMRALGEQCLTQCDADAATWAEQYFERARSLAQAQGALAWELRTATSLARLWRTQHRVDDAYHRLSGVVNRFTEGHETSDLREALALLEQLNAAVSVPLVPLKG